MNDRFLEEAKEFKLLKDTPVDYKFNRKSSAVLMESMRLRYEVVGDYDEYVKEFQERMRKALEACGD